MPSPPFDYHVLRPHDLTEWLDSLPTWEPPSNLLRLTKDDSLIDSWSCSCCGTPQLSTAEGGVKANEPQNQLTVLRCGCVVLRGCLEQSLQNGDECPSCGFHFFARENMSRKEILRSVESWLKHLELGNTDHLEEGDRTCNICTLEYGIPRTELLLSDSKSQEEEPELPVKLPCGHVFGSQCIKVWFTPAPAGGNGNTCPTCRRKYFSPWSKAIANFNREFEAMLRDVNMNEEQLDAFLEAARSITELRDYIEEFVRAEAEAGN